MDWPCQDFTQGSTREQPSIDPVENSVVAALGNTYGQESNTRRVKFQYYTF